MASSEQQLDIWQMHKDYKWIDPQKCLPITSNPNSDVLTIEQINCWCEHGYALVDGLLPDELIERARDVLSRVFPEASSPEDAEEKAKKMDFGSGGLFDFPTVNQPDLNVIPLHSRILKAVLQLFGFESVNDIRLMQAEPWAKYGCAHVRDAAHNQDQRIHTDYGNNTLAHPPNWYKPEAVAAILYYSDSNECLGPTAVVPRIDSNDDAYNFDYLTWNAGYAGLKFYNNRKDMEDYLWREHADIAQFRDKLYKRESKVRFHKGTILFYRHDIWHRGTPLIPGSVRYVHNLAYRRAECEWLTSWHVGWAKHFYETDQLAFEPWWGSLTTDQRTVLGYPAPGHSYWTPDTLRYNKKRWVPFGMDFTDYEAKMPN